MVVFFEDTRKIIFIFETILPGDFFDRIATVDQLGGGSVQALLQNKLMTTCIADLAEDPHKVLE